MSGAYGPRMPSFGGSNWGNTMGQAMGGALQQGVPAVQQQGQQQQNPPMFGVRPPGEYAPPPWMGYQGQQQNMGQLQNQRPSPNTMSGKGR